MVADKIRQVLDNAGLAEYRVKSNGKLKVSSPGYMIGANDKGECLLTYHTDVNVPCKTTSGYLDCYGAILRAAGLRVRPSLQTLALIISEQPAVSMVTDVSSYRRPPIEDYRRQLVRETAGMFRAAIKARASRGEYLTPDGACDIRRKMQTILAAPDSQLEYWRQRGGCRI